MFKLYLAGVLANLCMIGGLGKLKNKRGEVTPPVEPVAEPFVPEAPTITQSHLNAVVSKTKKEMAVDKATMAELAQFKLDTLQAQEQNTLQTQEEQGKYEEAKKVLEAKITDLSGVITTKDTAINDMKINNSLFTEVNKQNAHADAVQLLKGQTMIDEAGNVVISSKDANGIDVKLSVEQGVKQFLEARAYLVKANHQAGSGSIESQSASNVGGGETLETLGNELDVAMRAGNRAKINELRPKIKAIMASKV